MHLHDYYGTGKGARVWRGNRHGEKADHREWCHSATVEIARKVPEESVTGANEGRAGGREYIWKDVALTGGAGRCEVERGSHKTKRKW